MTKTKVWMLAILFASFMISSCDKGEAPGAEFSADIVAAATGQDVTFTDMSTNEPTSWDWNFGDGSTSTDENPVHAYTAEGIYTVSLTAENEYGSDEMTKTDYIVVTTEASEAEILITYLESVDSPLGKYYVNTDMPAIKSAEAVKTLLATQEVYIIDIRSSAAWDTAHIEGSVNMLAADVLNHVENTDLSAYTDISIVCYTGQTAGWLTSLLRIAGIDNVSSMKFGMCSWHDDFAGPWNNAIGNGGILDFDKVAVAKGAEGDLPNLTTGFETGADILDARLDAVLAEGFSAAAIGNTTVLDNKDNYYIINYWPAAEYADPGHIIGAMQYEPKTDIALDAALKTLPTDETIVVYCYTGQNSANLAAYLRLIGYDAKSLKFGTNGMIYDQMTKSQWTDGAIYGYDYWTPTPPK
ncbi:MAG: PKD domain-containing protein [Bacteroidales bacterium]|nr:PKD domain-containing protein [Bacteroidales bacterium]